MSQCQGTHRGGYRRTNLLYICLCHSVREATEEEAVAGVTCCTSVYVTVSGSHRGGGYRRGSLLYICLYTQYQGSHRGGGYRKANLLYTCLCNGIRESIGEEVIAGLTYCTSVYVMELGKPQGKRSQQAHEILETSPTCQNRCFQSSRCFWSQTYLNYLSSDCLASILYTSEHFLHMAHSLHGNKDCGNLYLWSLSFELSALFSPRHIAGACFLFDKIWSTVPISTNSNRSSYSIWKHFTSCRVQYNSREHLREKVSLGEHPFISSLGL